MNTVVSKLDFRSVSGPARVSLSYIVQERLFRHGYRWLGQGDKVSHVESDALFVTHDFKTLHFLYKGSPPIREDAEYFDVARDLRAFFNKLEGNNALSTEIEGVKAIISRDKIELDFAEFYSRVFEVADIQHKGIFPSRVGCKFFLSKTNGYEAEIASLLLFALQREGYTFPADILLTKKTNEEILLAVNFADKTITAQDTHSTSHVGCVVFSADLPRHALAFLKACLPVPTEILGIQGTLSPTGFSFDERAHRTRIIELAETKQKEFFAK